MKLSCKEGKRGKVQEHLSGEIGWVLFTSLVAFLFCFCYLNWGSKYIFIYEGGVQMKHYEIRRQKTKWPKGTGHRNTIRTAVYELEMVRYTAESPKLLWTKMWTADRAVTDHGDLTVKIRNRWTEKLLTKMHFHRRQGYLPKLVTKMNEIPTTFESSVVK